MVLVRHGKTGQNFLTRPEPDFFDPKQNRLTHDPTSVFAGSTQPDPNPNYFLKLFFLGKK